MAMKDCATIFDLTGGRWQRCFITARLYAARRKNQQLRLVYCRATLHESGRESWLKNPARGSGSQVTRLDRGKRLTQDRQHECND